jgi:hypothetical protein
VVGSEVTCQEGRDVFTFGGRSVQGKRNVHIAT